MPVRRVIQSESTPMRSAIGPFGTTRSGSLWPSPTTRAVRAGAKRPLMSMGASARSGLGMNCSLWEGGRISGGSGLGLDGRLDLRPGDDPLREACQDLARADLDEAGGAR